MKITKPDTTSQPPADSRQQITAFQYLKDVIKFAFSRRQYINKVYYISRRKRKIIAEDCYYVVFEGLHQPIPKAYLLTIKKPAK